MNDEQTKRVTEFLQKADKAFEDHIKTQEEYCEKLTDIIKQIRNKLDLIERYFKFKQMELITFSEEDNFEEVRSKALQDKINQKDPSTISGFSIEQHPCIKNKLNELVIESITKYGKLEWNEEDEKEYREMMD